MGGVLYMPMVRTSEEQHTQYNDTSTQQHWQYTNFDAYLKHSIRQQVQQQQQQQQHPLSPPNRTSSHWQGSKDIYKGILRKAFFCVPVRRSDFGPRYRGWMFGNLFCTVTVGTMGTMAIVAMAIVGTVSVSASGGNLK